MSLTQARSGRANDELREVEIKLGVAPYAEGSALISTGNTRVWCTASVSDRVPGWLEGRDQGWVTAEYSMLPRSTHQRIDRERASGSGRAREISRLIGRSLRAGVDLKRLGPRMITIDCDVLQADGGTRTAAITGGWVALKAAVDMLQRTGVLAHNPVTARVAAVSAGIVAGDVRLDLDYSEDSAADVDCNIVMDSKSRLIEVQGSAEGRPFSRDQLNEMLDVAAEGIRQLNEIQHQALETA